MNIKILYQWQQIFIFFVIIFLYIGTLFHNFLYYDTFYINLRTLFSVSFKHVNIIFYLDHNSTVCYESLCFIFNYFYVYLYYVFHSSITITNF